MEIESKYLDEETAQDGDIIEIMDAGTKENKPSSFKLGTTYTVYNFLVFNGRYTQIYTPGQDALGVFIKGWGRETENWKNKKFQVKLVDKLVKNELKKVVFPVIMEVKV